MVIAPSLRGTAVLATRSQDSLVLTLDTGVSVTFESWFAGRACPLTLPSGELLTAEAVSSRFTPATRSVTYATPVYSAVEFSNVLDNLSEAFSGAADYYSNKLLTPNYTAHVFEEGVAAKLESGLYQIDSPVFSWGWRAGMFTEAAGVVSVDNVFEFIEDGRWRSATQAQVTNTGPEAVLRVDLRYDFWQNSYGGASRSEIELLRQP